MYGMIHQAARDMALARMSQTDWDRLAAECGYSETHFIGVDYYPDAETLVLIRQIADRLALSLDEAFFALGRVWVEFTGASAYGRVLRMAGQDLESFIDNLDRMHASIKSNMPLASLPSFQVLASDGHSIRVLYVSERTGLAPFVHGILTAVAERFNETVRIRYTQRDDGIVFDIDRIPSDAQ